MRHTVTGTRWTYNRKATLVAAVKRGALTLDVACRENALSVEEFASWKLLLEDEGKPGLMLKNIPFRRAIETMAEENQ